MRLLSCLTLVAFSSAAFAQLSPGIGMPDQFGGFTTEQVIVKFERGYGPHFGPNGRTGIAKFDATSRKYGVRGVASISPQGFGNDNLADEIGLSRTFLFKVNRGTDVRKMIAEYNASPGVELAELDGIGGVGFTPNDPSFAMNWSMHNTGQNGGTPDADIDGVEGWDQYWGGDGMVLAILDTGIQQDHPDLSGRFVPGWNTNNNSSDTTDPHGHGTHVCGTAAANSNNGVGVAGVNWRCRVMPVRVLNSAGGGTETQCGNGIIFAADNGADVISMSLQYYTGASTFNDAVNYAVNLGCLVIAATGNNQGNLVAFPARFAGCKGVGATTNTDAWASFSNYGPECDISAPGASVYSTYRLSGYNTLSGTSMATPHVSGMAALLWAIRPSLNANQVFSIITSTADDKGPVGWDQQFGWGRINLTRGLASALGAVAFPSAITTVVGLHAGGNLASVNHSDDNRYIVGAVPPISALSPTAVVEVNATSSLASPGTITLLVEHSETATPAGSVQMDAQLYDWTNNQWTQVGVSQGASNDATLVIDVTASPARFVNQSTMSVRARVRWFDPGTLSTPAYQMRLDRAVLFFKP